VVVSLEVGTGLPAVEAVRDQLHQVMLNLVLNAIQASQPGGRIAIAIEPDGPLESPTGVRIQVSDSGEGITEENLEQIFDPFFTTKDPDQGTGLGLMISHQIVADHGGSIEVESVLGEGSTFHVRLPTTGPTSPAVDASPPDSPEA
jgi:signal transduction histidine kinase